MTNKTTNYKNAYPMKESFGLAARCGVSFNPGARSEGYRRIARVERDTVSTTGAREREALAAADVGMTVDLDPFFPTEVE